MSLFNSPCTAPLIAALLLATGALTACGREDTKPHADGFIVLTDTSTGCQYVARLGTMLIPASVEPLLKRDGQQSCPVDESDH